MARLGKKEMARYEGARWAIDMVQYKGVEATIKDLEHRGLMAAPLTMIDEAEIKRFQSDVKNNTVRTVCAMSLLVLLDEFDYTIPQLHQFMDRFNKKTECLEEDYATWQDYRQILLDETGIDIAVTDKKVQHDNRV